MIIRVQIFCAFSEKKDAFQIFCYNFKKNSHIINNFCTNVYITSKCPCNMLSQCIYEVIKIVA